METTKEQGLKKDIGFTVALSIIVGSVIGAGVFMEPGEVILNAGSSDMALLAWVLGGILTLASGLTIAEVCAQIPKTGGLYVYLEEVYGRVWGFLCGWVQTIIYGPAILAAIGLYFGSVFAVMMGWEKSVGVFVGLAAIYFLTVVNSVGTKYGGMLQTVFTVAKLIPIFFIIVFGLTKGTASVFHMSSGTDHVNFGAAILAALFAYDGWILVGSMAGEMKNPAKLLPKAIIVGLSIVTVVYLLVNVALLHVLPADVIVSLEQQAAGTAASVLFGDLGGKLVTIGILISLFGGLNGYIMVFSRIPFAMAQSKNLPFARTLTYLHPTFKTPISSILLLVSLATAYMFTGDAGRLSSIPIFIIFVFYILAFMAVFILRRRSSATSRPYSVPFYPIIPMIAIMGSLYIVGSTLYYEPKVSLLAIAVTLIGLPVYWLARRLYDK